MKLKLNPVRSFESQVSAWFWLIDSLVRGTTQPEVGAHGPGSRREGSARADQLPANDFALLTTGVDTPTKEELIASSKFTGRKFGSILGRIRWGTCH